MYRDRKGSGNHDDCPGSVVVMQDSKGQVMRVQVSEMLSSFSGGEHCSLTTDSVSHFS